MIQPRYEEKLAIEKCIRSFIIKSIHAIVQARNGIVRNTNCVSEVGARNNMMVYVEEDPEIGATIKQRLDANFPVHVQDVFSLEILTHWPKEPHMLMVVEVWQFRLDIADKLDSCALIPESGTMKTSHTSNLNSASDGTQSTEFAIDDFRRLRLFEKLGTLLKSIMVVTRLLPGYRLSRQQDPSDYQMCYALRRGPSDLSKLGLVPKCYQVGRIFSGLAIAQTLEEKDHTKLRITENMTKISGDTGVVDDLVPVYVGVTVYYRTQINYDSNNKLIPIVGDIVQATNTNDHVNSDLHSLHGKKTQKHVRVADATTRGFVSQSGVNQSKLSCRVKPAFAVDQTEDEPDELFDPASHVLSKKSADRVARQYIPIGSLNPQEEVSEIQEEDEDGDVDEDVDDEDDENDDHDHEMNEYDNEDENQILEEQQDFEEDKTNYPINQNSEFDFFNYEKDQNGIDLNILIQNLKLQCMNSSPVVGNRSLDDEGNVNNNNTTTTTTTTNNNNNNHINIHHHNDDEEEDLLNNATPLQLPFSTIGVSGARLTRLFAELRERANLDLFQVPSNNSNSLSNINPNNNNNPNTVQSSLFDADALAEELERHEKMLKEFDDFLTDFQTIEPFGFVGPNIPDVRQHNNGPTIIPNPAATIAMATVAATTNATTMLAKRTRPVNEM